jgi:hypothetical protein
MNSWTKRFRPLYFLSGTLVTIVVLLFFKILERESQIELNHMNASAIIDYYEGLPESHLFNVTALKSEHYTLSHEIKRCAETTMNLMPRHHVIVPEKLPVGRWINLCLQQRYHQALRANASRYDVLHRLYKEIGLTVTLKEPRVIHELIVLYGSVSHEKEGWW